MDINAARSSLDRKDKAKRLKSEMDTILCCSNFRKSVTPPCPRHKRRRNTLSIVKGSLISVPSASATIMGGGIFLALVISIVFFVSPAQGNNLYQDSPIIDKYYTVKKGDTLWKIAEKFYGDRDLYPEIIKLNPEILDPDIIEVDQKLLIEKAPMDREEYRREIRTKIINLMFVVRRIKFLSQKEARSRFEELQKEFALYTLDTMSPHYLRTKLKAMNSLLILLELHELTDAIMTVTGEDDWLDMPYLMAALAWQESHFLNRDGKLGEKSCFQILPSTAPKLDPEKNIRLITYLLKRDPYYAARMSYKHLKNLKERYGSWERALVRYNGNPAYAPQVIHKFYQLRNSGGGQFFIDRQEKCLVQW